MFPASRPRRNSGHCRRHYHEPGDLPASDLDHTSSATAGQCPQPESQACDGQCAVHQARDESSPRLHNERTDFCVPLSMRTDMGTGREKRGFSLLEMLIAMALGLIVLGSAVQLFKKSIDATRLVVQRAEMQ